MSQIGFERLVHWLVEGYVLYPLSKKQAEMVASGEKVSRTDLSKTSLTVYGHTPQDAIERFLAEYSGDVRVTAVRCV